MCYRPPSFLHFFSSSVLHSVFFISLSLKIDHLHCRKSRFVLLTHLSSHIAKNFPKPSPCTDQGSCAMGRLGFMDQPRSLFSMPVRWKKELGIYESRTTPQKSSCDFPPLPSVLLEMPRVWDESSLLQEREQLRVRSDGWELAGNE